MSLYLQGSSVNPLDLEEALFLQRRQELQRDLQLRQMLLQGQIDRQQNMHQQRMYELQQQFGAQQALANLQRDEQLMQDQLMRRRQLAQQQQQIQARPSLPLSAPIGSPIRRPATAREIAGSLAANSTSNSSRRPSGNQKRSIDISNEGDDNRGDVLPKRARNDSFSSSVASKSKKHGDALLLVEASMQAHSDRDRHPKPPARKSPLTTTRTRSPENSNEDQAIEAFKALSSSSTPKVRSGPTAYTPSKETIAVYTLGTIEGLIAAGQAEQKVDDAATVLVSLKDVGEISDSDQGIGSGDDDNEFAISISHPGFQSKLPQLPIEPEFLDRTSPRKVSPLKKSPDKKTDEDAKDASMDDKAASPANKGADSKEVSLSTKEDSAAADRKPAALENGDKKVKAADFIQPAEYPYPVDTWWPSITTVRRERKMKGEDTDDENFVEEPSLCREDSPFRADARKIQNRLANDVQPGVLEKIPHCKIHRLKMKRKKGGNIPDHAFCWQVTETYCNDIMVCCSICSTWRHAGCGGHYKPYSVRENVESKEPFVAICDLCYEEQALLQDFPRGEARLERQRIEQLRRALSTSAVIKQASFVKHGGTYKWPLGSVSSTHIGGHKRSVWSRHDKAEKTWTEMTSRLGRGHGYRPKERVKVRTREFERLLVCVEDAGTCCIIALLCLCFSSVGL